MKGKIIVGVIGVLIVAVLGFSWLNSRTSKRTVESKLTSSASSPETKISGEATASGEKEGDIMSNQAAVVYFSATGTTREVAQKVATATGADILEITPVQAYTAADLDWHDQQSRSSIEMNDPHARPEVRVEGDLSGYQRVFLGSPIWWGVCPRVINSFIESQNLAGKEIYLFVTSGSSGVTDALEALRQTYPELNFVTGWRYNGQGETEIAGWLSADFLSGSK